MQPAGSYNESFTMIQEYSDQIVKGFQKANDTFIWQADSSGTDCVDGLNLIITGSTDGVQVAGTASLTTSNIGDEIDLQLAALADDVQDREDLTTFMSIANFRKYITWLRNENNYHYDPAAVENRGGIMEMMHPFANLKVVGVSGLNGSNRMVTGPAKHIVVGTDLLSDFSQFQMWYDINGDQLKHRVVTKLGVNVAYPEFWVSNDLA